MKSILSAVVVAAFAGLAGCASNVVYEGKYAEEDGWRKGTVAEIGPSNTLAKSAFFDCRSEAATAEGSETYAVVTFLRNGHTHSRTTKLPANANLKVGDKVFVNFMDCNAPLPKQTS